MAVDDARRQAARARVQELARAYLQRGDSCGWFEALYAGAQQDPDAIPWADLAPNPFLLEWLDREAVDGDGCRAVVVGCGLGDDAEELARRRFAVMAFDLSPTAIAWCGRRFPDSAVTYCQADLLALPGPWRGGFDLVVESYTVQALPPALRPQALQAVAALVAPAGRLFLLCRSREPGTELQGPPWPLERAELEDLADSGLRQVSLEDVADPGPAGQRRFRAVYRRDGG